MTDFLVVKSIPEEGDFTTIEELDGLAVGSLAVVTDKRRIYLGSSTGDALLDSKEVRFLVKYSNKTVTSVNVPRTAKYDIQLYNATQNKIVRVGGITAVTALSIPTEGEGMLVLKNLSYNHAITSQKVIVSEMKKSSETPLAYLTRVINSINNKMALLGTPFATASLVTTTILTVPYYAINITCLNEHVDLHIGKDGIFTDAAITTTQEAICTTGKGVDVLQMEKDISRNRGNQGYIENPDLWYNQPTQTDVTKNYNIVTISWEGQGQTATSVKNVGSNTLSLAIETTYDEESLLEYIKQLFNTYYTSNSTAVGLGDTNDVNDLEP